MLCSACEPSTGGETGDLGGTPTPCGSLTSAVVIDEANAAELGFDIQEIERRLDRGVRSSFTWTPKSDEIAAELSGYEAETEIIASFTMNGIVHHRVDPATCEGDVCRGDGVEVKRSECPHWLEFDVIAEIETLDGALKATAQGSAVQWAEGFEEMIGPDTAENIIYQARADLTEVEGRLVLPEPPLKQPYQGALDFGAELGGEGSRGWIHPSLFHGTPANPIDPFRPLEGRWGGLDDEAAAGGAERQGL